MRVFLYGISAFSFWLTFSGDARRLRPAGTRLLKECRPDAEAIAYLEGLFPSIPQPYELLIPNRTYRNLPEIRMHASTYPLTGGPFRHIAHGICASSPELCFVQLARGFNIHELVLAGNCLCGSFCIDPAGGSELKARQPITSPRKIAGFLGKNSGLPGIKQARKALPLITPNTASPPESFLGAALTLPRRYGGYQLAGLKANQRITPSSQAQAIASRKTLVPDLCHKKARLAIEYDSNAEHMTAQQITRDAAKRLALEADGYKVITVTARQLRSQSEMQHIAEQAARRMGIRLREKSKQFPDQQRKLFRQGWSLDRYLRDIPAASPLNAD